MPEARDREQLRYALEQAEDYRLNSGYVKRRDRALAAGSGQPVGGEQEGGRPSEHAKCQ